MHMEIKLAWALGSSCPCPRGCCLLGVSFEAQRPGGVTAARVHQGPVGTQSPAAPPMCLTLHLGLRQLQWLPLCGGVFREQVTRLHPGSALREQVRWHRGWRLHGCALLPLLLACTGPWGSLRKGTDPLQHGVLDTHQGGANFQMSLRLLLLSSTKPSLLPCPGGGTGGCI